MDDEMMTTCVLPESYCTEKVRALVYQKMGRELEKAGCVMTGVSEDRLPFFEVETDAGTEMIYDVPVIVFLGKGSHSVT